MNNNTLILKIQNSFIFFALSVFIQFGIGASIWNLCSSINTNKAEKKLNVSLILPVEEQIQPEINKEVLQKPEIDESEIKPIEMTLDEILPVDPFEQPRIMEIPKIPKEKPLPKKEKKIIRKEAPKIVEPDKKVVQEVTEAKTEVVQPVKEVSITSPIPVKEKKQTPAVVSKPVLTKAQIDENSKYLAKVMKVFEKNKVYPSSARRSYKEGRIIVSFCINENGRTSKVKAKTAEPKVLAEAAEELVRKSVLPIPPKHWDFSAKVELPITYKLR